MSFLFQLPPSIRAECRILEDATGSNVRIAIPGTSLVTKHLLLAGGFFYQDESALTYADGVDVDIARWARWPIFLELPNGCRFVFYNRDGRFEFSSAMRYDECLDPIDPEQSLRRYKAELYPLLWTLAPRNPEILVQMLGGAEPSTWWNYDHVIMRVLEKHPLFLSCIPEKAMMVKYVEASLSRDGSMLEYVPRRYTHDLDSAPIIPNETLWINRIYKMALAQNGEALRFIPTQARTLEMCQVAVSQTGSALQWVPEHTRLAEYELCLAAVRTGQRSLGLLQFVPPRHFTEELLRALVKSNGFELLSIPKELVTYEICLEAIFSEPAVFRHIPAEFANEELLLTVVTLKGDSLAGIFPIERRTRQICMHAVKSSGVALAHVPLEHRDVALCTIACSQTSEALFFVPDELQAEVLAMVSRTNRAESNAANNLLRVAEEKERLFDDWLLTGKVGRWQEVNAALKTTSEDSRVTEASIMQFGRCS